jgi:hypothetical protein
VRDMVIEGKIETGNRIVVSGYHVLEPIKNGEIVRYFKKEIMDRFFHPLSAFEIKYDFGKSTSLGLQHQCLITLVDQAKNEVLVMGPIPAGYSERDSLNLKTIHGYIDLLGIPFTSPLTGWLGNPINKFDFAEPKMPNVRLNRVDSIVHSAIFSGVDFSRRDIWACDSLNFSRTGYERRYSYTGNTNLGSLLETFDFSKEN